MERTLITGATGFIGNHVTRLIVERGDNVRAMVMPGEDRSPLKGLDVEIVEGNLLDPASLERAVSGCNRLFHLAALFAVWTKDPNLHYKINVDGAESILRAAMREDMEKVVFTSSVAAIGVAPHGELATEETRFNGWEFGSEYILSKYISHQMVKGLVLEGLPATMVMPGLPFGPGDRMPTPTGSLIVSALQGKMKNYWKGGVCAVDVRDVAAGHVLAMDKGQTGESYILANQDGNKTHQEFLQLIGRVGNIENCGTREVAGSTMLQVARLMELWSRISGRAPMTTEKNTQFALQECFVSPAKAISELGLPQTPIETAVADSIAWFREHGYV